MYLGFLEKEYLHVGLAVLAAGILSIAAMYAFLLAIQMRFLRMKRIGPFLQALPPLETMEVLLFQMILFGFISLSVLLATSMLSFSNILKPPLLNQTVLSMIAWLVFAVLLWGRHFFGWRGKIAVYSTLSGFVLLFVSYLCTRL